MHAKTFEMRKAVVATTMAQSQNHQIGEYRNPIPVSRATLKDELGCALLRLQSHRRCTSLVVEFDHALRTYLDSLCVEALG
jgi:hypothetical protein